ncbi:hypothetical protein EV122DRAFT_270167 [Schizophyllum commune]
MGAPTEGARTCFSVYFSPLDGLSFFPRCSRCPVSSPLVFSLPRWLQRSALSISSDCSSALLNVASNPEASACLSLGSLTSLVTSQDESIVGPISDWLGNVCGAAACSNDTLSAITTNVTQGCSQELGTYGLSASDAQDIIPIIQSYYPTVREALCLSDGDTNCIVQTLQNFQTTYGDLTLTNIQNVLGSDDVTLPSNITCTDCTKALYNTVASDFGIVDKDDAASECGNDFVDGQTPSSIKQTASTDTASSSQGDNDGALSLTGSSGLAMAFVGSVFALLG